MSETSVKAREALKAKAHRMAEGHTEGPVDASGWVEPKADGINSATGMRPLSRRQFKRGGTVEGETAKARADRKPRGVADEIANTNLRTANEDRGGEKHVGGFANGGNAGDSVPTSRFGFTSGESRLSKAAGLKKGGRTAKAMGGDVAEFLSPAYAISRGKIPGIAGLLQKDGTPSTPVVGRKDGGETKGRYHPAWAKEVAGRMARAERKSGGRTGKVNVNIIVGAGQGAQPPAPDIPMPPPRMAPPPMPMPPPGGLPPGLGAGPPMGGMPPGGPPPMPRRRGGRTYPIDDGAGGGKGRLEKVRAYGDGA